VYPEEEKRKMDQEDGEEYKKEGKEWKGGCRLNICNLMYRSTGAKLAPGKSKCGKCYAFERSVRMANEAEEYSQIN
jgi:hypothetical protein